MPFGISLYLSACDIFVPFISYSYVWPMRTKLKATYQPFFFRETLISITDFLETWDEVRLRNLCFVSSSGSGIYIFLLGNFCMHRIMQLKMIQHYFKKFVCGVSEHQALDYFIRLGVDSVGLATWQLDSNFAANRSFVPVPGTELWAILSPFSSRCLAAIVLLASESSIALVEELGGMATHAHVKYISAKISDVWTSWKTARNEVLTLQCSPPEDAELAAEGHARGLGPGNSVLAPKRRLFPDCGKLISELDAL